MATADMKAMIRTTMGRFIRRILVLPSKLMLKRQLIKKIKYANIPYTFTEHDIALYIEEKFAPMPSMREVSQNDIYKLIEVGAVRIWWPESLPPNDLPWLYHEVFDPFASNPSSYDHPAMAFKDAKWILDGGAAEGYFSVFAMKKSTAHVVSVEPLTQMREALAKTLNIYVPDERFTILTAALDEQSGFCDVIQNNQHICDTTVSIKDVANQTKEDTVPVTTIDQIILEQNIKGQGIIKIDIEGFEMNALRGACDVLKELKPNLAIAVYHGLDNANECAAIIMKANQNYKIEYRGMYGYYDPPRPYMLFAY